MICKKAPFAIALAAALSFLSPAAGAKDKVKVAFIGPLTGGTAANGIGARNSAELAVKLRNADPKAKYEYELVVLDDECKPNVAVQVATKAAADRSIVASASHYCSVAAIAAVETYNRLGLPMVVWGAVLPDITYRNKYPEVHRVNGTMINQNEVAANPGAVHVLANRRLADPCCLAHLSDAQPQLIRQPQHLTDLPHRHSHPCHRLPLLFLTGTADLLIRMSTGGLSKRSSETVRGLPSTASRAHSAASVSSLPRLPEFSGGLRRVSPSSVRRCAVCTRRSRTASAMVGSTITSCQWSTGS